MPAPDLHTEVLRVPFGAAELHVVRTAPTGQSGVDAVIEALPLVLCHGGPGLWDYLEPLARLVHAADYVANRRRKVYRYDQRGCGQSTGAGPYTLRQAVADLEALRQHLGPTRWIVGGHSWGATLALHYALGHAEQTTAVLYISGIGVDPRWHADYDAERRSRFGSAGLSRLAELQDAWERLGTARAFRALCEHQWNIDFVVPSAGLEYTRTTLDRAVDSSGQPLLLSREVHRQLWADTKQHCFTPELSEAALRRLDVPVLLVAGASDPRPAWPVRQLAELLPRSSYVELHAAGHFPWVELPDELQAALGRFLVSTPSRGLPMNNNKFTPRA